jgi:hypothetical protein
LLGLALYAGVLLLTRELPRNLFASGQVLALLRPHNVTEGS